MGKPGDNFEARIWTVSKTAVNCGMATNIVQTSQNVTLVGAGQASKGGLDFALTFAPYLVAADGGAELVLNYGKTPKKVIGDFDSANLDILAQIPPDHQHRIAEQDSTDFDKCLRSIQAPLILGVGFLGARLDHQLAALNALVRHRGAPCILIGEQDLVFHLMGNLALSLGVGSRVSLFPMAKVQGTSQGLAWPIDQLELAPGGAISISNRVTAGKVHLSVDRPGLLVLLPKECLPQVIQGILAQPRGNGA